MPGTRSLRARLNGCCWAFLKQFISADLRGEINMKRMMMLVGATVLVGVTVMGQEQGGKSVKEITLPQVESKLPEGPGREAAEQGCVLCHSTRYITMQPGFSREAWTASVDKMRKTFGAPITNEQAATIVDYLVAVRGPGGKR
jgi:hypothetical protein